MKRNATMATLALAALLAVGCGGGSSDATAEPSTPAQPAALSAEQMEKGVGPVTTVSIAEVDPELAAKGETIFTTKCSACHKFESRYVGPELGTVLERRAPEYVMNMMLNPQEMLEKHPTAKALLAEYLTPMPSQNLTVEDARAVLEYIRTQQVAPQN